MLCPEHNTRDCYCPTYDDLIDLSGKMMSDGISQVKADELTLRLYDEENKPIQGGLF